VLERARVRTDSYGTVISAVPQSLFEPRFSPDGARLAFWAESSHQVWVSTPGGGRPHALLPERVGPTFSWSPDGASIVATPPDGGLVRYPVAGGPPVSLSDTGDQQPDWRTVPPALPSTGGSRTAFASSRDGNFEVYVMNADGTDQSRITRDSTPSLDPVWSPGEKRLAYVSLPRPSSAAVRSALVITDPSGAARHTLVTAAGRITDVSWSPDGSRLAYDVSTSDGATAVWTVVAATGGAQEAASNARFPRWSPTGRHVAYVTSVGGVAEIQAATPTGGSPVTLVHAAAIQGFDWSPDDRYLVNSATSPAGGLSLYVFSLATGQVRAITSGKWADVDPVWSADGRRIAFARVRLLHHHLAQSAQICVINADGTGFRVVAPFIPPPDQSPGIGWSADGTWLGFSTVKGRRTSLERANLANGSMIDLTQSDSLNQTPAWAGPGLLKRPTGTLPPPSTTPSSGSAAFITLAP